MLAAAACPGVAETIDIEAKLGDVLVRCFGNQGILFRERLLDADMALFDFGKKDRLLQGILKDKIIELNKKIAEGKGNEKDQKLALLLKELKTVYKLFPEEVIHPRNTMAHVEKQWDENGKCILKSRVRGHRPICVDHEWCIKARKDLIKHTENLDRILNAV